MTPLITLEIIKINVSLEKLKRALGEKCGTLNQPMPLKFNS